MTNVLAAFFTSFLITMLIIRTEKLHSGISGDKDFDGPQKFHKRIVPRIGGVAIGVGIFFSISLSYQSGIEGLEKLQMLLCALPPFSIGLTEDLTKKVSVRTRLIFCAIGAIMASFLLDARIYGLDIPVVDLAFRAPFISIFFTVFAVTGLSNSYNIIDGFNGLSSMVGIITLLGLGYIGIKFADPFIVFSSFAMAAAVLGFFLLNYPKGLIFLGDGGAYLIGFWVALLSILLVNRHHEISPWFAVMINAYPILETLFTIYRRKFHQGKSPGHPDGIHFHSLIFRRILNKEHINTESDWFNANAKTAPYLWVLCSLATIPAIIFWGSTSILITFLTLFTIFYIWLYKRMVTFKTPKWLHL